MSNLYKKSGVNIKKGEEVVKKIKKHIASTHNKAVLKNIGSFGGLYDLKKVFKKYKNPILVQSIDGVGTKLSVAKMLNRYDTVGADIVNHCCNDILAMGAKPLTFLDYVANEKLVPREMEEMVRGMAGACRSAGVALIGGETAEMPNTYTKGEHDLAGCITGVVEKDKIITGEKIRKGDLILGLPSNGLHTNGFSLARKVLLKKKSRETQKILKMLMKVHTNYCRPVFSLLENNVNITGIAHITGGGLVGNIPRILPKGLDADIKKNSWPVLPIFSEIQKYGRISEKEMYQVFNMGIGLILVIPKIHKREVELKLKNQKSYWLGQIIKGSGKVILK